MHPISSVAAVVCAVASFIGIAPAASSEPPLPEGNYQLYSEGSGHRLSVASTGDKLLSSRDRQTGANDLFSLRLDPNSGSYRILVVDTGRWLHADDGGDRLISTRYQPNDDFTRFYLQPAGRGYNVVIRASGRSWHEDGNGDRLVSTRYQPGDAFTIFRFQPSPDSGLPASVSAPSVPAQASPGQFGGGFELPPGTRPGVAAPRPSGGPRQVPADRRRAFVAVNASTGEVDVFRNGGDVSGNYVGTLPPGQAYAEEAAVSDVYLFARDGEWIGFYEVTPDGEEQLIELPSLRVVRADASTSTAAPIPTLFVDNRSGAPVYAYLESSGQDPAFLGEVAPNGRAVITQPSGSVVLFAQNDQWLGSYTISDQRQQQVSLP